MQVDLLAQLLTELLERPEAAHPELDVDPVGELRAHPSGGLAGRPGPERGTLDEDDVAHAGRGQVVGGAHPDHPAADDHHGGLGGRSRPVRLMRGPALLDREDSRCTTNASIALWAREPSLTSASRCRAVLLGSLHDWPPQPDLLVTEQVDLLFATTVRGWRRAGAAAHRSTAEPELAGSATAARRCLDVFDAQLGSRHLDLAARWLRAQGRGFYTIGSSGHEGNAAVAAALRVTDPALLHYRSGAFFLERARQGGVTSALRDVLLGVVAATRTPSPEAATRSSAATARRDPPDLDHRLAPASGAGRGPVPAAFAQARGRGGVAVRRRDRLQLR